MASDQSLAASFREVERVLTSRPTMEGGGVKLKRAFAESKLLDPFLLLDEFHSHNPADYSAGFPWHPHRGFETITYMIEGSIEHQDSAGNKGVIEAGGVQWMTAGSGVVHQEMPRGNDSGWLRGLQLWLNLPAKHKMTAPKYRGITADQIPEIKITPDVTVRIICGNLQGRWGPVRELAVDCQYLDVTIQPNGVFENLVPETHSVFAYVLGGSGSFGSKNVVSIGKEHTVVYGKNGKKVHIQAGANFLHCLLISGEPIGEPVAWSGSIVMNTADELEKAAEELEQNKFIKY